MTSLSEIKVHHQARLDEVGAALNSRVQAEEALRKQIEELQAQYQRCVQELQLLNQSKSTIELLIADLTALENTPDPEPEIAEPEVLEPVVVQDTLVEPSVKEDATELKVVKGKQ